MAVAKNAGRTKTGSTTKKTITGTNKSSTSRKVGFSPIEDVKMKYGGSTYESTGNLRGRGTADAAATRQYAAGATPVYKAPKTAAPTTYVPPGTGVQQASLTGADTAAPGGITSAEAAAAAAGTGAAGDDILAPLTGQVGKYGIRGNQIPLLYQEPQALLRMAMANMGMSANDNQGMYNSSLPMADLVNALSMVGLGNDYKAGDNSSMLNYMDNLFRQGLTRGGENVNFQAGMSNIVNANKDSPMGEMLNNEDPRGQYSALSSLMLPLAEAGMHPLFARSLQKSMERLRDEYYSRYANGTPPTSLAGMMNDRLGLGG